MRRPAEWGAAKVGRNSERILLLQLKRIGDFILTAPAVAALREARPQAEIVAVVPASVAGLARCFPGLSRVLPYRHQMPNLRTWAAIAAGPWDACADFAGTDRTAFMTRLSRAKKRAGYGKFADTASKQLAYTDLSGASVRDLHTVDFHIALMDEIGGGGKGDPSAGFVLPEPMAAWAAEKMASLGVRGGYAVIHPGTAREEKMWEPARWAEVAAHLADKEGLTVVVTGSNDDIERSHLAALKQHLTVPVIDLAGALSLLQTSAVIAGARIILGVDSMAMHLAAMFERPQVVLFGPTNPHHWRPRHGAAAVVAAGHAEPLTQFDPRAEGRDMNLISTEQIISAMRGLRSKSVVRG
jgi:ADP-heptose:LPS heptosyltransferase